MKSSFVTILIAMFLFTGTEAQNPVIFADVPDASMIRVGIPIT